MGNKFLKPNTIRDRLAKYKNDYKFGTHHANKIYQERLEELQQRCEHKNTTYIPDPSGNNDSYVECDDCGKHL